MSRRPVRSALAAAVVATALVACGGSADEGALPGPTATGEPTPAITPSAIDETAAEPPVPDAGARCSAGDLVVTAVQPEGVTEAAAETWNDIRSAAMSCDYEQLAGIAPDEGFTFTFGGEEDPVPYWRNLEQAGQPVLADLVRILGLPAAEDDEGNVVWPRVHVEPESDAAWEEVTSIYGPEVTSEWRETGSYLGARVGIAPDGTWIYFVAGD